MIEEALYTQLKNDSAIEAKVKVASRYHIYPLRLPDGFNHTYALTYTEIGQENVYPTLKRSMFQINCFATTFEAARNLALDVENVLNDLSDMQLGGTFGIAYIKVENRQSLFDDSSKLWYYVVEVLIKY